LPDFVGHPKLLHLKGIVLNHFMDAGEGTGRAGGRPPSETRIMVFAHFRDSAEEIVRVLNRHGEMVRAKVFLGQASAKGSEGMNQKTQLATIEDFKDGKHNVLVATSVGEEGLDIGEVDLIICYDASASPVRMLQRMGRTGRKRTGNIEVLLMRGKEENDFTKSRDSYEKMQKIIAEGKDFSFHFDKSPRIVPRGIEPIVDRRIVEIPFENTQTEPIQPTRKAKKPKPEKKFHTPDDAQNGFLTAAGKKIGKPAKQTKTSNKRAKASKPKAKLDTTTAALPSLDSVLLTAREVRILDQTYCQVAGDEPQFVQIPKLFSPSTQRKPRPIVDVRHSRVTRNLTGAFGAMREPRRDWTTPTESELDPTLNNAVADYADIEELEAPKRSKKRKTRFDRSSTIRSSGIVVDEDAYNLNDGFVDDGDLERIFNEDELDDDEEDLPRFTRAKPAKIRQPYFVSQRSVPDDEDDEDELPHFITEKGEGNEYSKWA
jgi:ATP-dependent DNA helicase MPH1